MEETKTCPKCGGEMEEGRLYPIHLKTIVTFGKPRKEEKGILTYGPEEKKEIIAYACKNCGYIELYIKKDYQNAESV